MPRCSRCIPVPGPSRCWRRGASPPAASRYSSRWLGGSESTDAWAGFLDELRSRGLRPPLLVISVGAAGLISATETVLARSLRQKCLIHRCRNVVAKVPAAAQDEIRATYWAIFDTDALTDAGAGPGHKLVTAVQARIDGFART
jgi:putative transposase